MVDPDRRARATTTSPWAVAALISSLVVACPAAGLVAIALALRARRDLREHSDRRGRGLATTAMILGAGLTIAYAGGAWWWNGHVRRPIREGPRAVFECGLRGDASGVRSAFSGPGAQVDDASVAAFFEDLTRRYGALRGIEPDWSATVDAASFDRRRPRIGYILEFERESVPLDAEFIVAEGSWLNLVGRWGRLRVHDSNRGDLVYPPDAISSGSDDD
ncbi:MAG: DUF4190 domain-containing protein [Planctomycetota bacterium]